MPPPMRRLGSAANRAMSAGSASAFFFGRIFRQAQKLRSKSFGLVLKISIDFDVSNFPFFLIYFFPISQTAASGVAAVCGEWGAEKEERIWQFNTGFFEGI